MKKDVGPWVQRFGALDAQEEEVVDDSAHYRALLGRESEEKARRATTQPEAKPRKLR